MVYSGITNKYYDPSNDSSVYIVNTRQAFLYLKNGASEDLVDILYSGTRNDCLVFVFKKTANIKHLYELWNKHELE